MPIVNIEQLEKEAAKVKSNPKGIVTKQVGNKTYFKGAQSENWYNTWDECYKANESEIRKEKFRKAGLNEYGQTPEDVKRQKETAVLMKEKEVLFDKLKEIDTKIFNVKLGRKKKESKSEVKVEEKDDQKKEKRSKRFKR